MRYEREHFVCMRCICFMGRGAHLSEKWWNRVRPGMRKRDIRLSMCAGMLWVNVFNARLNGFCRYIILRLFHNIFHIFSFATSAECSACLWSSCEWNRFRWDWKHSNHMKPETVIFHRLTSKLIPFHYVSMCARFFSLCVCCCCSFYVPFAIFVYFLRFGCEKIAVSLETLSARHRMYVLTLAP